MTVEPTRVALVGCGVVRDEYVGAADEVTVVAGVDSRFTADLFVKDLGNIVGSSR